MRLNNFFKRKTTEKIVGYVETNDPKGLLIKSTEPKYSNFQNIFVVDVSPWVFHDSVGINIETGKFYFCNRQSFNIGGAYGSNDTYILINNKQQYNEYVEKAYNNGHITLEKRVEYENINQENWKYTVNPSEYEKKKYDLKIEEENKEKDKLIIKVENFVSKNTTISFNNHSRKKYILSEIQELMYKAYSMNNGNVIYLRRINDKYRLLYIHSSHETQNYFICDENAINKTFFNSIFLEDKNTSILDRYISEDELRYILTEIYNTFYGDLLEKEYNYNKHIGCYGDFDFKICFNSRDEIAVSGIDYLECRMMYDFIRRVEKIALKEYK